MPLPLSAVTSSVRYLSSSFLSNHMILLYFQFTGNWIQLFLTVHVVTSTWENFHLCSLPAFLGSRTIGVEGTQQKNHIYSNNSEMEKEKPLSHITKPILHNFSSSATHSMNFLMHKHSRKSHEIFHGKNYNYAHIADFRSS